MSVDSNNCTTWRFICFNVLNVDNDFRLEVSYAVWTKTKLPQLAFLLAK